MGNLRREEMDQASPARGLAGAALTWDGTSETSTARKTRQSWKKFLLAIAWSNSATPGRATGPRNVLLTPAGDTKIEPRGPWHSPLEASSMSADGSVTIDLGKLK